MKKIVFMTLLFGMLTAFTTKKDAAEDPLSAKELTGYHLREKLVNQHDYNLWVITNYGTFDQTFESDHDSAARPNFDEELVLAAKVETSSDAYKIRMRKVERKGDALNYYFTLQKDKKNQPGGNRVLLTSYPRNAAIKKVNFYHDNVLVKTVAIVNVY